MVSYKHVSAVVIMALLVNLLMLGGGFTPAVQAEEPTPAGTDFNYVISNFEGDESPWEYTFGEQPNIKGAFEVVELADAYAGQHAGRLTADFTKSSKDKAAYTAIRKEFEGLELKRYAFWVKTSELKALRIRTTDATGQTFQQKINLQDTTEWQQVVVNPVTTQYWGGANNGKWNAPAKKSPLCWRATISRAGN